MIDGTTLFQTRSEDLLLSIVSFCNTSYSPTESMRSGLSRGFSYVEGITGAGYRFPCLFDESTPVTRVS